MSDSTARTAALGRSSNDICLCRAASPRGALLTGLLLWLSLSGGGCSPQTRLGTDALAPAAMGLGTCSDWGGVSIPDGRLRGVGHESSRPLGINPRQLTSRITKCSDVGRLQGLIEEHWGSFNDIHVGTAWGTLAKMRSGGGRGDERVAIERLQDLTREKAPAMQAREVSNVVHSLAKLGESVHMAVDQELMRRATGIVGDFNPQDVANLMWGLAKMGVHPDAGLLEAMQRQAIATVGGFIPQNVANLMWALATMGVKADAGLLEAMQRQAIATAGNFKPQNVANLMWALATMGVKPNPRLLEAMQGRATATARDFEPQHVANLLWALATMGIESDPRLLEAMQQRATVAAGNFKPQAVGNVLWALACFDTSPSQVSVRMVESMAVRLLFLRRRLIVQEKSQMHQWLLFCDLDPEWRGQLPRSMQKLKQELGGVFRQAFESATVHPSRLQADVAKQLRRLLPELKFEKEFVDPTSGCSIDIRASGAWNALGRGSRAGRGWAVEVDGPCHFLEGGSGRDPKGSTLLKRRLLEQLGYTTVSVPYWEWDALKGKSKVQVRRYLRDKLCIDQVPPPPSSLPDGKGLPDCSGGTEDGKGGEGKLGWRSSRLKRFT